MNKIINDEVKGRIGKILPNAVILNEMKLYAPKGHNTPRIPIGHRVCKANGIELGIYDIILVKNEPTN